MSDDVTASGFHGRVALVTGAGRGIGAAIAHRLAAAGALVVATDRRPEQLEPSAGIEVRSLDVTDRAAFARTVDDVVGVHGRVDLLVNNAGVVMAPRPLAECGDDEWERVMGVNAKGVFNGLACVLPHMVGRRSGVVLNIGSVSAVKQVAGLGLYGASKLAVTALTRTAALEAGPHGVRVNELQPGATLTMMVTGPPDRPTGAEAGFAREVPLGRVSTPEEQADAAIFLLSDSASYVNGASLLVDGGLAWT